MQIKFNKLIQYFNQCGLILKFCLITFACISTAYLISLLVIISNTRLFHPSKHRDSITTMSRKLIWPKIYFYGDSLTQHSFSEDGRWGSILANKLIRKADIIPRGFSGYNSRHSKALLPYLEADIKDATLVGVFLGANDARDTKLHPQQGVPLDEYKNNLKDIVSFIKKNSNAKSTFLITPPPYDEAKWNGEETRGNSSLLVAKYAEACKSVAKNISIPCVDLHTTLLNTKPEDPSKSWNDYLVDGLHFSPLGSEVVAKAILPLLLKELNEDKLGSNEMIMPDYKDLNRKDPEQSFREWVKNLERT